VDDNKQILILDKSENGVATLTLNNPPLNLITLESSRKIVGILDELEQDSSIRVLIIKGQGNKAFCAGADVKEFASVWDEVVEKKLKKENEAMDRIAYFSKPVIAAIENVALGGGCELCLACDMRIMSETARIGLPEINLGVFPGSGGLFRLAKLVGPSKAMELMFLGHMLSSTEALQIGLVNRIAPSGMAYILAQEIAVQIAQKSTVSVQLIKKGVHNSQYLSQDEMMKLNLELSNIVFKTKDCEEGIKAFFEKRTPHFNINDL
jgi:enoyl-CoA hydratase